MLSVAEGLRDAGTPAVPRVIDGPSASQSRTQGRGEESRLRPLDSRCGDWWGSRWMWSGVGGDGKGEESMSSDTSGEESEDEAMKTWLPLSSVMEIWGFCAKV